MLQNQPKYSRQVKIPQQPAKTNPNTNKSIQLQVNISIGKNKFLLQVSKCSNLHEEVLKFLQLHNINLKYQGPILSMVREQLTKKQQMKETNGQIQQLKRIKDIMENKRAQQRKIQLEQKQINYQKGDKKQQNNNKTTIIKQNKQNDPIQLNNKNNESTDISNKTNTHKNSKQEPIKAEQLKCQNVYQRWKIKQKQKEAQKVKNNSTTPRKQNKDKSNNKSFYKQQQKYKVAHKKPQSHSPDYFYNKGIKFQQAKEIHVQQLYKQHYPFKINRQSSLTPNKKKELHQRLFKQYRNKQMPKNFKYLTEREQQISKPRQTMDKYKQRIIQRDNKIDQALNYLIQKKMIQNPYKIQVVSKSPFRKTNL